MAKLNEEVVIIKVSELLKDNEEQKSILDNEMITNLEAVIQEIAGAERLVEIIKE